MKPILLAALLAATSASAAHEPAKSAPVPAAAVATREPALAEVTAVAERFGAALKAADFDTVRGLLDPGVLILEGGAAERSAEAYLGHHAIADAAFLGGATVRVLRRSGAAQGDTAWLGTESEITPAADGGEAPLMSTETMVFRRSSQGWRIVHIHWSSRAKKGGAP